MRAPASHPGLTVQLCGQGLWSSLTISPVDHADIETVSRPKLQHLAFTRPLNAAAFS